jgi:radical SAM protein with 4Fe4S-binding SPASM domain
MTNSAPAATTDLLDTSFPKWVVLQLLEKCNLRCRMCYEWGDTGSYREHSDPAQLNLEVVRRIIQECEPARPRYDLFGGEPLLYRGIGEVLRAVKQAGSNVHMPTNGTLLENNAEMLVESGLDRIWVSLDGPEPINDRQRGKGVFRKVLRGIDKLHAIRMKSQRRAPEIGVNMVVTTSNYRHILDLFLHALDIGKLDCVSLELQTYLTRDDHSEYETLLCRNFNATAAPLAKGYVGDHTRFSEMNFGLIARQAAQISACCADKGIFFNSYPQEMTEDNIRKYFSADWHSMTNVRKRCAFPWVSTEISARGDVTSCHSFYDLTLGNVNETALLDIWRGDRYARYRRYLRKNLLPICPACCLFYNEMAISD